MEDFQLPGGTYKRLGEWGGVMQYGGGDQSMIVMFYLNPVHNKAKSVEQGRPVYEDKIFVKIHPPGERLNIVDRQATDTDKRRWPVQWAQFQQNKEQVTEGTPIEMLFPAQPSIAAALKASGVHTIEQCGALSANAIETIGMGAQQWVNEAQRYLQVSNRGVKHSEMKKMIEDRDNEIRSLKHKLDLAMAQINNLRENAAQTVTMEQVQSMIANQGGDGKRAVYPRGKVGKVFDAQSAQIAATHPTTDLKKVPSAKRQRARINT